MWHTIGLVILWTSLLLSTSWCHHCDDETGPYKKLSKCNPNKTHFCYNLVEDLSSFSCRCSSDASCKEPCGINIFRAWSSDEGSWVRKLKKADLIPHIPLKTYAQCVKVPHKIEPPHRYPYTMCMCNDHYYSYGLSMKDEWEMRNFTKVLRMRLRFEKPKMYILSPENYLQNLPYIKLPNFIYRNCTDVSKGESYASAANLGTSWCNQSFCEANNPFGRDRPNPRYRVVKCAETCACYLEPSEETLKKAKIRNALIDIQRTKSDQDIAKEERLFEKENLENSTPGPSLLSGVAAAAASATAEKGSTSSDNEFKDEMKTSGSDSATIEKLASRMVG